MEPINPATLGQKAADLIAACVGSWAFIIAQSLGLAAWVVINSLAMFHVIAWDKPPFIELNLVLSFQAAFTGPIVMISQNRQEEQARQTQLSILAISRGIQVMLKDQAAQLEEVLEEIKD
jgi:uncharacterized membrane protein